MVKKTLLKGDYCRRVLQGEILSSVTDRTTDQGQVKIYSQGKGKGSVVGK